MNESILKFEEARKKVGHNKNRKNLIGDSLQFDEYVQGFIEVFDPRGTGTMNIAEIEAKLESYGRF